MNRRGFLTMLGVGSILRPSVSAASGIRSALGLQLFTVRELLQRDVGGTLATVAGLGYAEVEMFGFGGNAFVADPLFGRSAVSMRGILDRHALSAPCAQISGRLEDVRPIADTVHRLGIRYLIVAMAPDFLSITPSGPVVSGVKDAEQIIHLADRLNRLGGLCRKEGLTLGYHNHHMEFARLESGTAYDLLLSRTDPELVRMELDVGWARAGGAEPHQVLARNPGRFVSCHLKDFAPDRPADDTAPIPDMARMVAPGDGVIDFPKVLAEMDRQGIEHGFVECDLPGDAIDVARRGIRYLKGLRSQ